MRWAAWLLVCVAWAGPPSRFQKLGTSVGLGGQEDNLVAPGPNGGQRWYLDYTYDGASLDLVAVDPDTAAVQVFSSPVKSEYSPKVMAAGPDGNVYVGTAPGGHLLRLETSAGRFTDLGRPSSSESYIWQTALGPDGKIYGCTYPSAKLVRYDPATGKSEDLGRMDPLELYARYVAATADGFVYVGIGYGTAHVVAFQISTGTHRDILPAAYQVTGVASVRPGTDGKAYAVVGTQSFRLEGFAITPIGAAEAAPAPARNVLADGRRISLAGRNVQVSDPHTGKTTTFAYNYAGQPLAAFRVGLGPDGMLYASTVLPLDLLQADPALGNPVNLGQLGGGEAYSLMAHNGRLLIAAYSGNAPLMSFDPMRPMAGSGAAANPALTTYTGMDGGWRPQSMIAAPDGKIYIGAVAGYGKIAGPMTVWDPAANRVDQYPLYDDQSVVSVAASNGVIVAGGN